LRDVHNEVIRELSHGYRQRVGLAQAIVHKPALLILDEPSAGLDPAQIIEMRTLLRGLHGEHTVLISSHFLTEISQTCDRLLVIHNGELVGQGSESELATAMGQGSSMVELEIRGPSAALVEKLAQIPTVTKVNARPGVDTTVVEVSAASDVRAATARLVVEQGVDLLRLDRSESRLESIFMNLTQSPTGGPQ
jgi:ABC-2 type transport system ATP-binding protein